MRIKSIILENIRSYLNESITFAEGSTLLIGDIGCGKTTILLAIEFALFGTRRTELDASSLLRNGTNNGSVTLDLDIEGKQVTIKRVLKRGKKAISQDAGYIVINGAKEEGTAVELKSRILSLLGYPEELVTKSKSLIYRYTVFTPQEDMKRILFDTPEERLNTLRKLFNMDKYKRIKENAQIFMKELRATRKAQAMNIEDLDGLKEKQKDLLRDYKSYLKQAQEGLPVLESLTRKLNEKTTLQTKLEGELQKNETIKRELKLREQKQKHLQEIITKNEQKSSQLGKEIEQLYLIKKPDMPDIEKYEQKLDETIKTIEEKRDGFLKELSASEYALKEARKIIEQVDQLEECPTCFQLVTKEHKHTIEQKNNTIAKQKEMLMLQNKTESKLNQEKLIKLKENKERFRSMLIEHKEFEMTQKRIEEKKAFFTQLEKESTEAKQSIKTLEGELAELRKQVKEEHTAKINELKTTVEQLRQQHRKQELMLNDYKKEVSMKEQLMKENKEAIDKKEIIKKMLVKSSQYQHWMEDYFVKVVDLIEKQVFVTIHREFDETFRTWFANIIDDETIDVRLDESFSPLVEQNGYEQFVENLSGGEKTSVALAYRLALNKAVNDFVGTVKTNNLIILDEPTDGFSADQLDRMREVLEKLNMEQTIIVSHEPKMETYVQHVLHVVKRDHVSSVS